MGFVSTDNTSRCSSIPGTFRDSIVKKPISLKRGRVRGKRNQHVIASKQEGTTLEQIRRGVAALEASLRRLHDVGSFYEKMLDANHSIFMSRAMELQAKMVPLEEAIRRATESVGSFSSSEQPETSTPTSPLRSEDNGSLMLYSGNFPPDEKIFQKPTTDEILPEFPTEAAT